MPGKPAAQAGSLLEIVVNTTIIRSPSARQLIGIRTTLQQPDTLMQTMKNLLLALCVSSLAACANAKKEECTSCCESGGAKSSCEAPAKSKASSATSLVKKTAANSPQGRVAGAGLGAAKGLKSGDVKGAAKGAAAATPAGQAASAAAKPQ